MSRPGNVGPIRSHSTTLPEVPFRGGGFAPRNVPLAGVATLLGMIALWQVGDSLGLIPTLFLPAPVDIAVALYHLTISGELWKHLSASLARLAVGWIVGTVFGIGMGLALTRKMLERMDVQLQVEGQADTGCKVCIRFPGT